MTLQKITHKPRFLLLFLSLAEILPISPALIFAFQFFISSINSNITSHSVKIIPQQLSYPKYHLFLFVIYSPRKPPNFLHFVLLNSGCLIVTGEAFALSMWSLVKGDDPVHKLFMTSLWNGFLVTQCYGNSFGQWPLRCWITLGVSLGT